MRPIRLTFAALLLLAAVGCKDIIEPVPGPDGKSDTDTTDVVPVPDEPVPADPIPVGSVTFDRDTLALLPGASDTLSVTVLPEDADDKVVTWSSSDGSVATVQGGIITAVSAGSAFITASAGGETAQCRVEVSHIGQSLSFDIPSVEWSIGWLDDHKSGDSYPMPQIVAGAETDVTYTSSDASVAEICGDMIRLNGSGTATITAEAVQTGIYSSASASYELTVTETPDFNLENPYVRAYLDEAFERYNDRNVISVSSVNKYCANSASNKKDIPAPAMVYWEKSYDGVSATVRVFSDPDMTCEAGSATTTADSAAIYNLIPGNMYYYKVTERGYTVARGKFSTSGRCRMLKISDTYGSGHGNNFRDLGGLPTVDGRKLRYGMIYRGSNLDATTSSEKECFVGLGIMADIDLRKGVPTATSTTSIYGLSGCNQPFYDDKWDVSYVFAGFESFEDLTNPTKIKKIVKCIIISAINGEPCYLHCAAGADRTGYICMLLEAALGVELAHCSIDYELTSFSIVGLRTRDGAQGDIFFSPGRRYIDRYGTGTFNENACQILLDAGITQEQLDAFKDVMLQ